MPQLHRYPIFLFDMPDHLFCQINGAMLPASAAERYHQVLEPTLLIIADAAIDKRSRIGNKLLHAFQMAEIVDHRLVFPRKGLESLLASRVGKSAGIKDKAP